MQAGNYSREEAMTNFDIFGKSERRSFLKQFPLILAGGSMLLKAAPDGGDVIVETATGKVRGTDIGGIKVFKRIPDGASTAGKNRFMPPVKPAAWTGVRDALAFGPSSPQLRPVGTGGVAAAGLPDQNEDCLVLNVFTESLRSKRPVM